MVPTIGARLWRSISTVHPTQEILFAGNDFLDVGGPVTQQVVLGNVIVVSVIVSCKG